MSQSPKTNSRHPERRSPQRPEPKDLHFGMPIALRAVGATVVSPALQRGVTAPINSPESRRDGAPLAHGTRSASPAYRDHEANHK